jgi:hypothetical protein
MLMSEIEQSNYPNIKAKNIPAYKRSKQTYEIGMVLTNDEIERH